jgi:hypothetical protein
MDKEELKEYLRDNLKVRVKAEYGDYDGTPSSFSVRLFLEDEEISYDNDSLR